MTPEFQPFASVACLTHVPSVAGSTKPFDASAAVAKLGTIDELVEGDPALWDLEERGAGEGVAKPHEQPSAVTVQILVVELHIVLSAVRRALGTPHTNTQGTCVRTY